MCHNLQQEHVKLIRRLSKTIYHNAQMKNNMRISFRETWDLLAIDVKCNMLLSYPTIAAHISKINNEPAWSGSWDLPVIS